MTLALVAQLANLPPRVTHHESVDNAHKELGIYLLTSGYTDMDAITNIGDTIINGVPTPKPGIFLSASNAFQGCLDIDKTKRYICITHTWTDEAYSSNILFSSADSKDEAIEHARKSLQAVKDGLGSHGKAIPIKDMIKAIGDHNSIELKGLFGKDHVVNVRLFVVDIMNQVPGELWS